jgi:aconitase B
MALLRLLLMTVAAAAAATSRLSSDGCCWCMDNAASVATVETALSVETDLDEFWLDATSSCFLLAM